MSTKTNTGVIGVKKKTTRKKLTIAERKNLIADKNNGASVSHLMEKYDVSKSTVMRVWKRKEHILKKSASQTHQPNGRCRTRESGSRTPEIQSLTAESKSVSRTAESRSVSRTAESRSVSRTSQSSASRNSQIHKMTPVTKRQKKSNTFTTVKDFQDLINDVRQEIIGPVIEAAKMEKEKLKIEKEKAEIDRDKAKLDKLLCKLQLYKQLGRTVPDALKAKVASLLDDESGSDDD